MGQYSDAEMIWMVYAHLLIITLPALVGTALLFAPVRNRAVKLKLLPSLTEEAETTQRAA